MVSAGDQMLRAKGRALRGSEPRSCWNQVRALTTLQGGRLQLLPSAQDPRAQPALPSGERQGDTRETERGEEAWPVLGAEAGGAAGAGPPGVAGSVAAAASGLGCGTHRPTARPCRSGPRTGA